MTDLRALSINVLDLFLRMKTLKKESAIPEKLVISQDALSLKMYQVQDSLSGKIDLVNSQLFSRITDISNQMSTALHILKKYVATPSIDKMGKEKEN